MSSKISAIHHIALYTPDPDGQEVRRQGSGRDGAFDTGSLNHFAVAIGEPDEFIAARDELMRRGLADAVVYDARDWLSIHAADPDGLFLEVVLPRHADRQPPFELTASAPPTRQTPEA